MCGAAAVDVTPSLPTFLHGYPHTPRTSSGSNDPLLASALAIDSDGTACIFVAVDVILIGKGLAGAARRRIAADTGVAERAILISATHTHSGPVTVAYVCNESDPIVPPPDPRYVAMLEDAIVRAAVTAWTSRRPAELAIVRADATGIGTCRHDPLGPNDLSVPTIVARDRSTRAFIGIAMVCSMHPTVLHEDSTLFSGDFPAYARRYLQRHVAGKFCPVLFHLGAAGDQSPRHVTRGNTFAEAERLGDILGTGIANALASASYRRDFTVSVSSRSIDLPARKPPTIADGEREFHAAERRHAALIADGAPRASIRTAECDCFGAEETLTIARAAAEGRLADVLHSILPAEVQLIRIGEIAFIGWPGEVFIEFALALRQTHPNAVVITLANGELQGYLVTQAAVEGRWYEAGNALLRSPDAGNDLLAATRALLDEIGGPDA